MIVPFLPVPARTSRVPTRPVPCLRGTCYFCGCWPASWLRTKDLRMVRDDYDSGRNRIGTDKNSANIPQQAYEGMESAMPTNGNQDSMNLNNMLLVNIRTSDYFRLLAEVTTFEGLADQIYYDVHNAVPWVPGTHNKLATTGPSSRYPLPPPSTPPPPCPLPLPLPPPLPSRVHPPLRPLLCARGAAPWLLVHSFLAQMITLDPQVCVGPYAESALPGVVRLVFVSCSSVLLSS